MAPRAATCGGSACSSRMHSEPQRQWGAGAKQQLRRSAAGRRNAVSSTAGRVAAVVGIAAGAAVAVVVFLITLVIAVTAAIVASPALLWLCRSGHAGQYWRALYSSPKGSSVAAARPGTLQLGPIWPCREAHSRGAMRRLPRIPEDGELLES
eukprot:TRINITY_DN8992_c0_g1_i1.p1 TRINITY_DN8992_c0_g1~~TRINITY_DN8992_c0_g1_i1.p1  ORF type:complete len:174 (+),score=18.11 TRINITY_DN8992_c0_g1_i1:67-522(+)